MKRIGIVIIVVVCALLGTALVNAQEGVSGCDAVIQYMKAGAGVIRTYHGPEKDKRLADLKSTYQEKMRGAPKKAVKLAEAYLNVLKKGWEKADNDTVFKVIEARDAALKACGKTPVDAGF